MNILQRVGYLLSSIMVQGHKYGAPTEDRTRELLSAN